MHTKLQWVALDIESSPDPALEKFKDDSTIVPVYPGLPADLREGPKTGNLVDVAKIEAKEAAWQDAKDEHHDKWLEKYNKECALDPFRLQIHMICCYRRESPVSFTTEHQSEGNMLQSFWDFVLGRTGEINPIVTFNGRKFDCEALLNRTVYFYPDILTPGSIGLVRERWLGPKWKTDGFHIDMCEATGYKSLAFCAKRLLGMEKGEGGGRMPTTPEEWKSEIEYCMQDSRIAYNLAVLGQYIRPDGDVEVEA